jgi:hypothetical protein
MLIGKLKDQLIYMLLEEDEQKRDILYSCFLQKIQQNIVPVRKNRSVPRNKKRRKGKANRYAKAKRRCL